MLVVIVSRVSVVLGPCSAHPLRPGGTFMKGRKLVNKHGIFIVEDHQLFREGLKSMLKNREDVEILGEAEDGLEALRGIRKSKPDLVLLDLSMPKLGGISVINEVKRELPVESTCRGADLLGRRYRPPFEARQ